MNIFIKKKRKCLLWLLHSRRDNLFAKKQLLKNIVNNYTDRHFNRFTLLMTKRKTKSLQLFSTSTNTKRKNNLNAQDSLTQIHKQISVSMIILLFIAIKTTFDNDFSYFKKKKNKKNFDQTLNYSKCTSLFISSMSCLQESYKQNTIA